MKRPGLADCPPDGVAGLFAGTSGPSGACLAPSDGHALSSTLHKRRRAPQLMKPTLPTAGHDPSGSPEDTTPKAETSPHNRGNITSVKRTPRGARRLFLI